MAEMCEPVWCAGFDYSRLSSAHKGLTSKKERESLSKKLKDDIDTAAAELAASAPNMKALEQYEAIREKEKQQVGSSSAADWLSDGVTGSDCRTYQVRPAC